MHHFKTVITTLFILYFLAYSAHALDESQDKDELKKEFVSFYCDCFNESLPTDDLMQLFGKQSLICIDRYFKDHPENALKLFEKRFELDTTSRNKLATDPLLGDYMEISVTELVEGCPAFKSQLENLRQDALDQMMITPEIASPAIASLKRMRDNAKNQEEKISMVLMLGVVYDYLDQKEKAQQSYQAANEIFPTIMAYGLMELLDQE